MELALLSVKNLVIVSDKRRILNGISFHLPTPGVLGVVGPGGSGKSSLLRAIAGRGSPPQFDVSGTVLLNGTPVCGDDLRLRWIPQRCDLERTDSIRDAVAKRIENLDIDAWLQSIGTGEPWMADAVVSDLNASTARYLSVMLELHGHADVYLVDEPTAGLTAAQRDAVLARLREIARQSVVVLATHNRQDCLFLGGATALVVGGEVQELAPSQTFFQSPQTAAGRSYVETGNCNAAFHGSKEVVAGHPCWWVVPGLLGGMSRPGIGESGLDCFRLLAESGVRILICMEERCYYDVAAARRAGITHYHFPVPDMAAPTFSQAVDMCRIAEPALRANKGVVVHCRGGLGRTGTQLALLLVWFGDAASNAINSVRAARAHAIQSDPQIRFIHDFADRISDWR